MGTLPRPSAALPTFSYDTVDYDHYGNAFPVHSILPCLRAHTPLERDRLLRPLTRDDQLQPNDSDDFLAQPVRPDNHQRGQFTPSHSPTRTAEVPDHAPKQEVPGGHSTQPNAFQIWLKTLAPDSPKYTTIDGQDNQESRPDLQEQELRQVAEVLRGTTKEEVVKIVNQFEGFACNDKETCLELVSMAPIFPGLVAYAYTHLVACPRRGWVSTEDWSDRVSELKQLVERWSKYGDTECILSYDTIRNRVFEILRVTEVRPEEHKCNAALLNGTMVLNYDILNLAALAAQCITGSRKKDILDERSVQIGKLVELFHILLEADVELEEGYRRYFFNALIMFSKESGYCPRGIYLAKGTISGLVSESQGGFGFVYKGKEYKKQLSKEAIVWRHLRHPNCLPLHGIYIMPTDGRNISYALVSPWMDQGTLSEYLEHNAKANRTKLILDVVRGLNYLHSMQPHVAHRDIKPDNILITRKGHACLADFGLVSTFDTDDHFHTATSRVVMGGTRNYMAPEIFNAEDKEAKRKAYTGKHPFGGLQPERVRTNVISNQRPVFPEGKISLDMWSFVENLWDQDPLKRLTGSGGSQLDGG
ncbi:kinase-like domain-containing protein [Butyriboletus roseoflavus]|nr:kinase-like domain-containing protein [Butyriboletus roseoflavus]